MKHRIGAAAIAVGMVFAPGVLLAGTQEQSCTITSFDVTTGILSGPARSGNTETVKHVPTTVHVMIGDPNLIPSDPCRTLAQTWNLAVFEQLPMAVFNQLLTDSASNSCRVEYVRSDVPDADGAYRLIAMRPAK